MNENKKAYNRICEQWYEFRKQCDINTCIVEFVKKLKPNSKILDIGCGTGYPIASYCEQQGFMVTGIDVSENMIQKAKELHLEHATFLVKDILEFTSIEKYDAIIAFDSLWHIPYNRQKDIYPIVSSLLNVGGYFLFTHGKSDGSIIGTMFKETFYYSALDIKKVHELLMDHGFTIVSSIENYQEKTTGDRDLLIIAQKVH